MSNFILCEKHDDVTTITLNRPEIGNRVSDQMAAELAEMLDNAAKESQLILFQGAGEEFCLGREAMGQRQSHVEAYEMRGKIEVIFNCYDAFRRSKAPVIGVVQGRAVGFGCALAALCDITIASDKARFQLPEMAHNIMPTIAMSALVDRVARKALLYLVYSAEEIDAQRALCIGLASHVVPANQLESAVKQFIDWLRKRPRLSLAAVKEYVGAAYFMDTSAANDFARNLHATINSSSAMRP